MSCQQISGYKPTEILEINSKEMGNQDIVDKEEDCSTIQTTSCFGVGIGNLLKKNQEDLTSNSDEEKEDRKVKCLPFFKRREKINRSQKEICFRSQITDNEIVSKDDSLDGSANIGKSEHNTINDNKNILFADNSESTDSEDENPTHFNRVSRYSEGILSVQSTSFDSNHGKNRPRAYSSRNLQHLKFPMIDARPLNVRRNAICEEIERDLLIQGLTLRQWRKIILTNYSLMDFDLRF